MAIDILRAVLGVSVLLLIAFAFSNNRKKVDWRLVGTGVVLQLVFALLVLKVSWISNGFDKLAKGFVKILEYSDRGADLLFGPLMNQDAIGFIFAVKVLPTIIFFSALTSLLYYLGILQKVVYVFAWVMTKTMRLSGAESLAMAGNIFLGQTEAPLLVKPYLEKMTPSEIMCLMTGGMATIAGGVLALYINNLSAGDEMQKLYFARHLIAASIMAAPAALVVSKLIYPEDQPDKIDRKLVVPKERIGSNVLDALSIGTTDGLKMAVNVGAMLLVFTALMYMVNGILGGIGDLTNLNDIIKTSTSGRFESLSLQYLLGMLFSPLAWLMGTDTKDVFSIGQLLGEKTILNELIAYQTLADMKASGVLTNEKSIIIAVYSLCGFANFASIGIQIGGISILAPNQRGNLVKLGFRSMVAGTLATLMTATIVAALV